MKRIQRTITIKAPAQRVFEFLAQPTNLLSIWPSMIEVSNIQALPTGGSEYDWVYKMAGVHLKGHTKTTEYKDGKLLVTKSEGGVVSTFNWKFEGLNGGETRFTSEIEYTIPVPVIGKVAEALVAKLNEREADTFHANLKDVMEHGTATTLPARPPPPRN